MAYLLAASSAAILVNFGAQWILSYLLTPADVGVVGMAYTVAVFIQLFEQGGVGDVLVQRKAFRSWAIPGCWISLTLGLCSTIAILIAAPIAAAIYRTPQLMWVLIAMAPGSIASALIVVPRAQLSRQLRFRLLATVNLMNLIIRMSLTVLLAKLGFGPFSYAIPVPVTNVAMTAFLWWWVRPPFAMGLRFNRWRYLIGDSSRMLTAEIQRVILDLSDYALLGLYRTPEIVGLYWFGFSVSIQLLQLLSINLMGVLFPALKRLNDQPQAQFQGFLKAQRILAMVGISACLLQAAISEPMARLFLAAKWAPSIVVMQILCVGMAMRMVAASSFALQKSQGRFREMLWDRWGFVVFQIVGLILVLSLGGGIIAVAVVVSITSTITGLVTFRTSIKNYGAGWVEVFEVLARPTISGVVSVGTAWLIAQLMANHGYGYLAQLVETIVVALALNAAFAKLWMRPVWDDVWMRVWQLLPSRGLV